MQHEVTSANLPKKFRCPACTQMMSYGQSRCDNCDEEAPVYNRRGFWLGLWICLGLSALATMTLLIAG